MPELENVAYLIHLGVSEIDLFRVLVKRAPSMAIALPNSRRFAVPEFSEVVLPIFIKCWSKKIDFQKALPDCDRNLCEA